MAMYETIRKMSTELINAVVYLVVAGLSSISFLLELDEQTIITAILRIAIIVLLVGFSFLLIKKDADRRDGK
jgi:FtsH-binding integral membrane protein